VLAGEGNVTGMAKQELLRLKIAQCLVETDEFDLIAMGRPEGPGCYCFANHALRATLKEIADDYPYVVIDNEAGLENLSRRIVRELDLMILVADPSRQGLETVRRLRGLVREMKIKVKKLALVINRLRLDSLPEGAAQLQAETGAFQILALPDDDEVARLSENGGRLQELTLSNRVVAGIDGLICDAGVRAPRRAGCG
jgi:CO dehydrogenase maturation factor